MDGDTIKQAEMKEKNSEKNIRDKHKSSPPCKILGIILKIDKGRIQKNGPKDKKINDYALVLHQRDDIDRLYVSKKEEEDLLALRIA